MLSIWNKTENWVCYWETDLRDRAICFSSPQVPLPPNGQLQIHGLPPGQSFPAVMPPMGHMLSGMSLSGSSRPPGFPGVYHHQNAAQQQQVGKQ